jgi:hypothetical protein
MIHRNPADSLLRAADRISLIDPSVPGWQQLIVDNIPPAPRSLMMYLVVDIPVCSTDVDVIQAWRERILKTRL